MLAWTRHCHKRFINSHSDHTLWGGTVKIAYSGEKMGMKMQHPFGNNQVETKYQAKNDGRNLGWIRKSWFNLKLSTISEKRWLPRYGTCCVIYENGDLNKGVFRNQFLSCHHAASNAIPAICMGSIREEKTRFHQVEVEGVVHCTLLHRFHCMKLNKSAIAATKSFAKQFCDDAFAQTHWLPTPNSCRCNEHFQFHSWIHQLKIWRIFRIQISIENCLGWYSWRAFIPYTGSHRTLKNETLPMIALHKTFIY